MIDTNYILQKCVYNDKNYKLDCRDFVSQLIDLNGRVGLKNKYSENHYANDQASGYQNFMRDTGKISLPGAIYATAGLFTDYDFWNRNDKKLNNYKVSCYNGWLGMVSIISEIVVTSHLWCIGIDIEKNRKIENWESWSIFQINDWPSIDGHLMENRLKFCRMEFDKLYVLAFILLENGIDVSRNFPKTIDNHF